MSARKPKKGDPVTHEGQAYEILDLVPKAYLDADGQPTSMVVCIFDNPSYQVKCNAQELVWLDEDGAWFLPGRLLSQEARAKWRSLMGMSMGPPAHKHLEARAFLRSQGEEA